MKRKAIFIMALMVLCTLVPMATGLSMDQSLGTADVIFQAATATGGLGAHVDIIGDVNGDGFDDLLMSDPWNDTWRGNVYLFHGRAGGWNTALSQANTTFYWTAQGDYLGTTEGIGDINGDGFDDFMIGMPDADDPGVHAGMALIYFGKANGWGRYINVKDNADAMIKGTQMFEMIGQTVAGLGDVNGDGFDDFAIGQHGKGPGWVHLFLGSAGGWNTSMNISHAEASFHGHETSSFAGYSIDGGDVNGDGLDDIVIGAPGNDFVMADYQIPGDVYVVFGKESGWQMDVNLSTDADASLKGEHWDDYFGHSVAVAGDVNGDGCEDILAGTPFNDEVSTNSGKAYLYMGRRSGWTTDFNVSSANASFRGESQYDQAGKRLGGLGDVNGDGLADFLIAAPINDDSGMTSQGQAYLFLGKRNGWAKDTDLGDADASWIGEHTADWAPDSIASSGDVDHDALDDVFLGATNSGNRGKAYLIFPFKNQRPSEDLRVELFEDGYMTKPASYVQRNDTVFVRMRATDADPANVSVAEVAVQCMPHDPQGFVMDVRETGTNTGTFVGNFTISNRTHEGLRTIKALPISKVRVTSVANSSAWDEVSIGGGLVIESFSLENNGDPVLYAEKRSYEFKARINDSMGHVHLDHVNLSFPLTSGKMNYTYAYDTNSFTETADPGYYARLDGASFADFPNENVTIAHFKIFFNFTFPDELFHTADLTVVSKDRDTVNRMLVDVYRVENDLDLYGDLEVRDGTGKLLSDGDPVHPGEELTFTNAMVVYQGAVDQSPPDAVFDVAVEDDDGNVWVDPQSSGAFFVITAEATNETDLHEVFNVTITGVPEECVNSSYSISFVVDGDQVSFSDPTPPAAEWQASRSVMATINITDTGGSLVKGTSIEYRVKPDGGTWADWTSAGYSGLAPFFEATAVVDLNDGPANAIQWRATDGVGNLDAGGNRTQSDVYAIKVDTVPPELDGEWPAPTNVSKTLAAEFGIKVKDQWALVDGASIEYTISTDDQVTWSNWTNAGRTGAKPLFVVAINETFLNGTGNWVRWRASDMLGNGPTLSEPVQVKVDTTGPTPGNNEPVIAPIPDVTIEVGETFERTVTATDADGDMLTWELVSGPTGMTMSQAGLLRFKPTQADVGQYDVTVKVSDGIDDVSESFSLRVIMTRPSLTVTNTMDLIGILKDEVTVTGTATAGVGDIQYVEYCIDGGKWQNAIGTADWAFTFDTNDLDDGGHTISIRAVDEASTSDQVDVSITVLNGNGIDVPPVVDTLFGIAMWLFVAIIAFVLIIVIVIIVVILMLLRSKGGPPPQQPQQPPAQPPPQQPQQPQYYQPQGQGMYQQQQYQGQPYQYQQQPTTEAPPPEGQGYETPPPGMEPPPPTDEGKVQQQDWDQQQ